MRLDISVGLNCYSELVSYAAVEEDCTSGLVKDVFDDSDKVGADVVLFHSCPRSCMPNSVEGLLQVYEDMVVVLLYRVLMTWIKLALMLYFFMVAHKGACQT